MAKTVILTGGTGLIGSELFRQLRQRGDNVIVFTRDPQRAATQLPGAAEYVHWEAYQSEGGWQEALSKADAVIHLAGAPVAQRWNDDYKRQIYDTRVLSTRYIVQALARAAKRPSVFVSGSAVGYYGVQGYGEAVPALDESAPPASDFLAKVCIDWEKEALAAQALGVRTVVVRTGVVLSTKSGALEKMLTPFRLFAGGPIGSGKQWVSWIHLDDEVGIFLFALDRADVSGALNATAPEPVMMSVLASTLGRVLSRPSIFPVPKAALQVLFGEAADVIAEGQRVIPKRLLELGYTFQYPRLEDALRDLIQRGK
ncbi:MAG: TIGR01777 family oxidoreductase [Chloroherpetonaceae bacterium]|nr:TIGR01777 family oxidoreductase [Chloroherpetonaceae bacterium]MCS7210731.1 TIGR01777 family oxidoreductase [Chloroherpetonaceae bacterium]MDW8019362.1 TIGR01777 family oxidoreductase [Chloroherpetonaceae bacterium]MDW8465439.1 TIGR01777 family oxidoreductase [Chloroherpetonaceae bacterium]